MSCGRLAMAGFICWKCRKDSVDVFTITKDTLIKNVSSVLSLVSSLEKLTSEVIQATPKTGERHVDLSARKELVDLKERAQAIIDILKKKEMKISVFGRTSSGKSTVINALLGDEKLPAGRGQVTQCFVRIYGVDDDNGYLINEMEPNKKQDIQNVHRLANAYVSSTTHAADIKLYLPKTKHRLLENEFVILDSPGIDVDEDLDKGISKYCDDSDVFVLVVNGESAMSLTEKSFFERVSKEISIPNIFILINRWDLCEKDKGAAQLKEQHLKRSRELFKLIHGDVPKRTNRVFFVSAKTSLESRMKAKGDQWEYNAGDEFDTFQEMLTDCVSKYAVETKCIGHIQSGKNMCDVLQSTFGSMIERLKTEQLLVIAVEHRTTIKRFNDIKKVKSELSATLETEKLAGKIQKRVEGKLENVTVEELIKQEEPGEKKFNTEKTDDYKEILSNRMKSRLIDIALKRSEEDIKKYLKSIVDTLKEQVAEIQQILSEELSFDSDNELSHEYFFNLHDMYGDSLTAFKEDKRFKLNFRLCALFAISAAALSPLGASAVIASATAEVLGFAALGGGLVGFVASVGKQRMTWEDETTVKKQFVENANKNFKSITQELAELMGKSIEMKLHVEVDKIMKHLKIAEDRLNDIVKEEDTRIKHLNKLIKRAQDNRERANKLHLEFAELEKHVN